MRSPLSQRRKESAIERVTKERKKSLVEATSKYHQALPGSVAGAYLESRGLFPGNPEVAKFRLGYVAEPSAGHEQYRGMLAIPYLRKHPEHGWFVVSIRFRRTDDGKPKYLTVSGDQPWLYNTQALIGYSPVVAITEGEIDALTASLCGVPAVGVPGAQMWQPYFRELFLGYRDVYVLADGDAAGRDFAEKVARSLPNAKIVDFPQDYDTNSYVIERGKEAFLNKLK